MTPYRPDCTHTEPRSWMSSSASLASMSSSIFDLFHQLITHFYQTILDKNLGGITLTYKSRVELSHQKMILPNNWIVWDRDDHPTHTMSTTIVKSNLICSPIPLVWKVLWAVQQFTQCVILLICAVWVQQYINLWVTESCHEINDIEIPMPAYSTIGIYEVWWWYLSLHTSLVKSPPRPCQCIKPILGQELPNITVIYKSSYSPLADKFYAKPELEFYHHVWLCVWWACFHRGGDAVGLAGTASGQQISKGSYCLWYSLAGWIRGDCQC